MQQQAAAGGASSKQHGSLGAAGCPANLATACTPTRPHTRARKPSTLPTLLQHAPRLGLEAHVLPSQHARLQCHAQVGGLPPLQPQL